MNTNFVMKSIRLAGLAALALLPGMACTYSATSPAVGPAGGNVAVQVYTQPGCPWTAENSLFGEVYSGRFGTGSGVYWLYIRPNAYKTRTTPLRGYVVYPTASYGSGLTGRSSGGGGGPQIVFQSTLTQYGR